MKQQNRHAVCFGWQWIWIVLIAVSTNGVNIGIVVGGEPEPIRPAASLPASNPWDLHELSKAPEFAWGDGKEDGKGIRSLYYMSEIYQGKPTRVFAYYATPETINGTAGGDKRFPAIVLVHGGGGTAFPQWAKLWAERGYAAIAIDLAGNGPNKTRLSDGGPGQGHDMKFETIGQPVTEQWTYHAVANVIRAHSLVRSFPEVDLDRTAITGISWGGYLTCIVAGLDNRFQAAVPVYGCGFLQENSCWLADFAKMSPEHQTKWVKLWEPSKYVGSATMPMLFVNGGKDFAYPPDSHANTFSLVQSPKYLHFVPDLPHGHIFDRPKVIERFIDHQLNNGTPLAQISSPRRDDHTVTATVTSDTDLIEATLHYTEDKLSEDANERTWATNPAKIEKKVITAAAPPGSATVWFLTVKDERETVVSSPLVVAGNVAKGTEKPRTKVEFVPNTRMTPFQVLTAMGAKFEAGVTKSKRNEYRRIFRMLDSDGNKKLSRKEYVDDGRFANRQVRRGIFLASDQDRDGFLTEAEYTTNRIVTDEAKRIMSGTDVNGDGKITRDEFLANAEIKNEDWVGVVFAAFDTNGDEILQTPEYLRVWGKWARP